MSLPPLSPRINVWLEVGDEVALSDWRVALLEAVDRYGSINAAAAAMGIQYRLAWQRIHEMEERLGLMLVQTAVGGAGGGGSVLTPTARDLISRFRAMHAAIEDFVHEQAGLYFGT